MIPHKQNVHKFISDAGHEISQVFKTKGILYSLIEDCISETVEIVAEKYRKDIEYFGDRFGIET